MWYFLAPACMCREVLLCFPLLQATRQPDRYRTLPSVRALLIQLWVKHDPKPRDPIDFFFYRSVVSIFRSGSRSQSCSFTYVRTHLIRIAKVLTEFFFFSFKRALFVHLRTYAPHSDRKSADGVFFFSSSGSLETLENSSV